MTKDNKLITIPNNIQEIINKQKSGSRLRKAEKGLLKQFEDTKVGFKVGEKIVVRIGKNAEVGLVTNVTTIKIPKGSKTDFAGKKVTFIDTDKRISGFHYHFNKFDPTKYAVQHVYGYGN